MNSCPALTMPQHVTIVIGNLPLAELEDPMTSKVLNQELSPVNVAFLPTVAAGEVPEAVPQGSKSVLVHVPGLPFDTERLQHFDLVLEIGRNKKADPASTDPAAIYQVALSWVLGFLIECRSSTKLREDSAFAPTHDMVRKEGLILADMLISRLGERALNSAKRATLLAKTFKDESGHDFSEEDIQAMIATIERDKRALDEEGQ